MKELSITRAEIIEISRRLDCIREAANFHPWTVAENADEKHKLETRLRKLRLKEFILNKHGKPTTPEPLVSAPMPLFRQNGKGDEAESSFVVSMLVGIAFVGVIVAFLLHAAGVLTQ